MRIPKHSSSTHALAVVLVLALAWSAVSGTVGPSREHGPPPAPGNAGAQALEETLRDKGWVDIAYRVPEDFDDSTITIDVGVRWPSAPANGDNEAFWTCMYHGVEAEGDPFLDRTDERYAKWACVIFVGDVAWEYEAQLGDTGVAVEVLNPMCHLKCEWDETTWQWTNAEVPAWAFDAFDRGDVVHFLVMAGGRSPVEYELRVEWNGTNVETVNGNHLDRFTYAREDFDADLYARADVPLYWYRQEGAERDMQWMPGDGTVWFIYRPHRSLSEASPAGYERPDGSNRTLDRLHAAEFVTAPGTWRFWMTESHSDPPFFAATTDVPVLWGGYFEWANLD